MKFLSLGLCALWITSACSLARANEEETPPAYSGWYFGSAQPNGRCQVGVPNGLKGPISIQWTDSRGRTDGCIFTATQIEETRDSAKASGTNGRYRCKIRLNFDNTGKIESADFAYGGLFNFGYNIACAELKELGEF
jgi:hypothetical protein